MAATIGARPCSNRNSAQIPVKPATSRALPRPLRAKGASEPRSKRSIGRSRDASSDSRPDSISAAWARRPAHQPIGSDSARWNPTSAPHSDGCQGMGPGVRKGASVASATPIRPATRVSDRG
jgi:hypothetical protein